MINISRTHLRILSVTVTIVCHSGEMVLQIIISMLKPNYFKKPFSSSKNLSIRRSCRKYLLLTKLFDEIEAECLCFAFFIDIGDSSHQWTQNDLGMIFEEINLKSKFSHFSFFISKSRVPT